MDNLVGSKCQAPFTNKYGATSYHNALISGVEMADDARNLDDIQVLKGQLSY